MFELTIWALSALFLVGALAGFVDTLAGGGGMLTIPALLLTGMPPESALATNKLQACFGSVTATAYFVRRGQLDLRVLWRGIVLCGIGAALGVILVRMLPNALLYKVLPILLMGIALVFILMPKLGEVEREARWDLPMFLVGAVMPIGFYDGFLGPGTGSFLVLALVSLRGYTLQRATIEAKALNATSNVVSLLVFLVGGKMVWLAGFAMAGGQFMGARLASGMIIARGNQLIRPAAISMSLLMSLTLAWKYWF
ncbi:MAG: TSUP family transporter [Cardiobacteriaceae bacterium]|nr:TSUP family transporter [Cardiobacteriaceae bacterium]